MRKSLVESGEHGMAAGQQRVLIFGTGAVAETIVSQVAEKYQVAGFLDNAAEKQHQYWKSGEWKIYAPGEHSKLKFDKVVLASTDYAAQMFTQLLGLGIKEHNIIVDFVCRKAKVYIGDFLFMQVDSHGDFNRLDLAVKYFAIESYMAGVDDGITLYKKMQQERLKLTKEQVDDEWDRFQRLIDSIRKNGYEEDSSIVCDERMRIMDGAHRVAICSYFHIMMLPVKITPQEYDCNYRIEWFWDHKFLSSEIKDIERENEKLMMTEGGEFLAFIWPPAMKFSEEIKAEISEFAKIKRTKMMYLAEGKLSEFIRTVYSVDDIENWKVEKKIEHMQGFGDMVEIAFLSIDKPRYRLKTTTALPLSVKVEEIKKIIRNRFKDRIDDYFYDNILHIADNYYQSRLIDKILKLPRDISECFREIKDFKYALCKLEVPYMSRDFPKSFPIHKDADMLCKKEDYKELVEQIKNHADIYAADYGLEVRTLKENVRTKIRIEYLEFLIYQFDISYDIENLGEEFVNGVIDRRKLMNGIYALSELDEIEVRKNECVLYPNKEHHKKYLSERGITIT